MSLSLEGKGDHGTRGKRAIYRCNEVACGG